MNVYSFVSRWNRFELLIATFRLQYCQSSSGDKVNCLRVANNINRGSGIESPEAWIPTIRKHNSRPTTKRTCEGTTSNSRNNNEDRNAPTAANHHATNSDT